ncbi:DUF2946 family protein [Paracoccus albus]|uniref:DUF2946 family protein n=1 Tax=Paracoccus albus TaxID=3017784 RepID=UPI00336AAA62
MLRNVTRSLLFWAMILPLTLASMIAAGVMPVRAANGTIMMVICDTTGMREVAVDAVTLQPLSDQNQQGDESEEHKTCSWSAAHPHITLHRTAILPAPDTRLAVTITYPSRSALIAAHKTGLPPSTGPPTRP